MITQRPSRAESASVALFDNVLPAQLDEICFKLKLPTETLNMAAEPATRVKALWDLCRNLGGTMLADLEDVRRTQLELPASFSPVYVSTAESDRDDPFCQRFFTDLVDRLSPTFPGRDLRYFDEANRSNPDVWSPWALRALREASVFIGLFTADYFRSTYCGRVWAAFRGRLEQHKTTHLLNEHPPLILPVLWGPPDENPVILPVVARNLKVDHARFGGLYAQEGLKKLVQHALAGRTEYAQAYSRFLDDFVGHMVQMRADHPLEAADAIDDLPKIDSVFYEAIAQSRRAGDQGGSKYAKFVFIAARKDEINKVRTRGSYGENERQWRPYDPPTQQRIETVGTVIADENQVDPEVFPLDDEWLPKVQIANRNGNIILVVVDPWTVQLPEYRHHAENYDAAELTNSTLLVCWNLGDGETSDSEIGLRKDLVNVFFNKLASNSSAKVVDKIRTIDDLRNAISTSLQSGRRDSLASTPNPNVAAGLTFNRPNSVGPSAAASTAGQPAMPPVRTAQSAAGPVRQPWIRGPEGRTQQ